MKSIGRKFALCLLIVLCFFCCKEKKPASLKSLHICTELPLIDEDTVIAGRKGFSALKYLVWPKSTRNLTVSFLDGDTIVHRKVMEVVRTWERHCGIKFNFGKFDRPDILISFLEDGSWSYIGTSSKEQIKKHKPSMNLGWLEATTSDEEYRRVVLHEFGHALGLVHEHLNPKANPIEWNVDSVYDYYRSLPVPWKDKMIEANFFKKYNLKQVNGSDFDPESIMLYAIPKAFTKNGFSRGWNTKLSKQDTIYINQLYPKSFEP